MAKLPSLETRPSRACLGATDIDRPSPELPPYCGQASLTAIAPKAITLSPIPSCLSFVAVCFRQDPGTYTRTRTCTLTVRRLTRLTPIFVRLLLCKKSSLLLIFLPCKLLGGRGQTHLFREASPARRRFPPEASPTRQSVIGSRWRFHLARSAAIASSEVLRLPSCKSQAIQVGRTAALYKENILPAWPGSASGPVGAVNEKRSVHGFGQRAQAAFRTTQMVASLSYGPVVRQPSKGVGRMGNGFSRRGGSAGAASWRCARWPPAFSSAASIARRTR